MGTLFLMLQVCGTFFLIGLFGFGGGYGMLSLIQHEVVVSHQWMTSAEFTNIVAISQMTPGPIGINSATYCGYTALHKATDNMLLGVAGSVAATVSLVLPSFVLMLLISKLFLAYMKTNGVQSVFAGLRPAVVGLLAAAALLLCNADNFGSPSAAPWDFTVSVLLFVGTFLGVTHFKVNPIRMILYAAFAGILFLYK